MKTSLYNHKATEEDGKPLIPNIIFKALIFLATHHCQKDADYIYQNYSLTDYQKRLYELIKTGRINTR